MTDGPTPNVTYRLIWYRPIVLTVLVGLGLVAVAMVLGLLAGPSGPLAVFVVLWLAAFAWNAYGALIRIAYEVGIVDGSILRWCSITRCREVPLSCVTGIDTPFRLFGAGLRRIVIEGDRCPLVLASPGYRDVVAMIVQYRPDIEIQTAWYDVVAERFSKRTAYWRKV